MAADPEYERRKSVDFLQAEGLVELPRQLEKTELPKVVQAKMWAIVYGSIQDFKQGSSVAGPWKQILSDFEVELLAGMVDQVRTTIMYAIPNIKSWITESNYAGFYQVVQWLLRHPSCPNKVRARIESLLVSERCAFRVVGGDTLLPFATENEHSAIATAISTSNSAGYLGAEAHLRNAIAELSSSNYPDSVRESIHAVEAVARILSPETKTLGEALNALERNSVPINHAMKKGFSALYGYTNDEAGIRHAMMDGTASNVDETDAVYMLGACSAFTTYLINKKRSAP